MLDTNTVNFAMDKLSSTWESAALHLQNVSEEYVKFTVVKAVVPVPMCLLLIVLSVALLVPGIKHNNKVSWEPTAFGVLAVVGGSIGLLLGMVGFAMGGYEAIFAIACPEMYTIHQIIGAAK